MTLLDVLVPVLGRPHRVRPTLDAFAAATPEPHRVLFIASPDDPAEQDAIRAAGAELLVVDGNYAVKIREGVRATSSPLVFLGADDLLPQAGWLDVARSYMRDGAQVVGVNDLCSARVLAGTHATHFLLTREAAELPTIDGRPGPLCDLYDHSCVDDELFATARHRGMLAVATDSIVAHLHPDAGRSEWDETYAKGRAMIRHDRRLMRRRAGMWA